jgi:hypothetical protein
MSEKITILTGKAPFFYYERKAKIIYKSLLQKYRGYKPLPGELSMYGGHYGVSRSMIEGLQKIGYTNFNYNPSHLSQIGDVVVVSGNMNALRQAIKWKKKGKIKRLIAGPNLCVLPTDYPEISSPEIDTYIVHADWSVNLYETLCPSLKGKMATWPAGINEEYWQPNKGQSKTGKKILFYKKRPDKYLYDACIRIAKKYNFEVTELIWGNYTIEQYKTVLSQTDFLVHFVEQESQGISLSEAWSMNIPTIVWNPGFIQYGLQNFPCSSAPFLTNSSGRFFNDIETFENLFRTNQFSKELYDARSSIINSLTDKASATILLAIINEK